MKTLVTALAGLAILATPLAAAAEGFHGGGHPGGGFGGGHAAPAPAFRSGGDNHGGGFAGGYRGPEYRGAGYAPVYRGGYARGGWAIGAFLPALYWNAYLNDPFDYGLGVAPYGSHWVAVDGEALLIDNATGAVIQTAPL